MPRSSRFAFAVLIALALAILLNLSGDTTHSSLTLRGDFPAFYAAAHLAKAGGTDLYDNARQREIENSHWPSLAGNYYSFAYPPYVAALLSPLAFLPPLLAKGLFTALLLAALWLSALYLRNLRFSHQSTVVVFAVLLCCAPIFIATLAGQNVSLSILLLLIAYAGCSRSSGSSSLAVGLACGLWAFKPQFAVILLLLLFFAGEHRSILWALLPLGCYYLLGAFLMGADWPIDWLAAVAVFAKEDFLANQHQMISLLGFGRALATSVGWPLATVELLLSIVGLFLLLQASWLAYQMRGLPAEVRGQPLAMLVALSGPLCVLVSPHSLFYELGISLVALALLLPKVPPLPALAGFWALLAVACYLHEMLPVDALAFVAVASYFFVYQQAKQRLVNSIARVGDSS